jgi:hypothetical protein
VTAESLLALLAGLGSTPGAVADSLRAAKISGRKGDICHCPVAMLLRNTGCRHVTTTHEHCRTRVGDVGEWVSVETPEPVGEFMRKFDRGEFPDLNA